MIDGVKERQHGLQRQQTAFELPYAFCGGGGLKLGGERFEQQIRLRVRDAGEIRSAGFCLRRVPPGKLIPRDFKALLEHHRVEFTARETAREQVGGGERLHADVGTEFAPLRGELMRRLRDNVEGQARASFGVRALSAVVKRPWLQAYLPQRTALLRVASIQQVSLEDWLLEQKDIGK